MPKSVLPDIDEQGVSTEERVGTAMVKSPNRAVALLISKRPQTVAERFTGSAAVPNSTPQFGKSGKSFEVLKMERRAQTAALQVSGAGRDRMELHEKRVSTPLTASFPIEQVQRCEKIFHLYDEDERHC